MGGCDSGLNPIYSSQSLRPRSLDEVFPLIHLFSFSWLDSIFKYSRDTKDKRSNAQRKDSMYSLSSPLSPPLCHTHTLLFFALHCGSSCRTSYLFFLTIAPLYATITIAEKVSIHTIFFYIYKQPLLIRTQGTLFLSPDITWTSSFSIQVSY